MKRKALFAVLLAVPFFILFYACEKVELASLTTLFPTEISENSAQSGGEITNDGGGEITSRGVVWSTQQNPTIEQHSGISTEGEGTGFFTSNITDLSPATTYYVRAYATNSAGTAYGNQHEFITVTLSTVTTSPVTDITTSSATGGGEVTDDGGAVITARGIAYSTSPDPTTANSTVVAGRGTGEFTAEMTGLTPGETYYVRAYATSSVGTAYGNQVQFETEAPLATVTTSPVTDITDTSARGGGDVTDDGGTTVTARGIAYGSSPDPTTDDNTVSAGSGTGAFTADMTDLAPGSTYYVRAYATTIGGTTYGDQVEFSTTGFGEVYNPATGKTWMDRNLGASRVATSSTDEEAFGDLYQWGRAGDGHQKRTSGTTSTVSEGDTPGHGHYILSSAANENNFDWRSTHNDNLWQGLDGVNNPCPPGFRLPTDAEWEAERASWSSDNAAGAFGSPLKLTVAGLRLGMNGSLMSEGVNGYYWSADVDGAGGSRRIIFTGANVGMFTTQRSHGHSVRCIKD